MMVPGLSGEGAELDKQIDTVMEIVGDVDKYLRSLKLPYTVDEVGILARRTNCGCRLVSRLIAKPGFSAFYATSEDATTSFQTTYSVDLTFLATPSPFLRFEVMSPQSGVSPLHSMYRQAVNKEEKEEDFPVVHFSFKVPDLGSYHSALVTLGRNGAIGQGCTSGYGLFSYWPRKTDAGFFWVKPRVNLRDTEVPRGGDER
jgi:hypothetical protein